jgi:MoxR-like ATPase
MDTLSTEEFRQHIQSIEDAVGGVIVGQKDVIEHVLIAIIAGGNVLLEGVPGLGKTVLIRTLGEVLELEFARIQFTPDLMPADIVGTEILVDENGQREFRFQPGPIFANLVLADEINRATPKTQSALLEAMQEMTVTVAQQTYRLAQPFFVLATQNPIEMEGTYPLPEAQLDRFMFKVDVRFPAASELNEIILRTTGMTPPAGKKTLSGEEILRMRELALNVPTASHLVDFASRLVVATHPQEDSATEMVRQYVRYGASPRGAQALIRGAKVRALKSGRYNVAFDDIEAIASAALRHRILLNFEGLAEGVRTEDIITDLLESIPREAG